MKGDYTTNSHYLTLTQVGRMYIFGLGSERVKTRKYDCFHDTLTINILLRPVYTCDFRCDFDAISIDRVCHATQDSNLYSDSQTTFFYRAILRYSLIA